MSTNYMVPYMLTDVTACKLGLSRVNHGVARRSLRGFMFRALEVVQEVMFASVLDVVVSRRPAPPAILRMEEGVGSPSGVRSVALYVHWSPTGAVSEMVRRQLSAYRQAGFGVVFISTAPTVLEADWQDVSAIASLVVHRRNTGRDFGAWRDLLEEALRRVPDAQELLLTNDSVLGPIMPLAPLLDALRSNGNGVFGLTESLGGGPHLQSYFVLARGRAAIGDLANFLRELRLSSSKWLIVQRGEVGLTSYMLSHGHRVMALFGYERVVTALAADAAQREALIASDPRLAPLVSLSGQEQAEGLINALRERPLNPTHHLWVPLVKRFGFPFVKTDLLRRNPHGLSSTQSWPRLVDPGAPCPIEIIADHLRLQSLDSDVK